MSFLDIVVGVEAEVEAEGLGREVNQEISLQDRVRKVMLLMEEILLS